MKNVPEMVRAQLQRGTEESMLIALLNDFASALRHLGDAEFFASVGIATFGLAALFLLAQLRKVRGELREHATPGERDAA